jgi:hypothetical protein
MQFDLIYADAWLGKFSYLEEARCSVTEACASSMICCRKPIGRKATRPRCRSSSTISSAAANSQRRGWLGHLDSCSWFDALTNTAPSDFDPFETYLDLSVIHV